MTESDDLPDGDEMTLVVPFIVCQSQGGPYEDDAFVAGFACGVIDKALQVASAAGATRVEGTVRTALLPQLELCAMARGFPVMDATGIGFGPRESWVGEEPEWSLVTFATYKDEGQ